MFKQDERAFNLEMAVSENVISGSLNTEVVTEESSGCLKKKIGLSSDVLNQSFYGGALEI